MPRPIFLLVMFNFSGLLATWAGAAERNPHADPKAIVEVGSARFTVLTSSMIRMEWAADGIFEDRASILFHNRRLTVPEYEVSKRDGCLMIETSRLILRYWPDLGTFDENSLQVELPTEGDSTVWEPGLPVNGNLGGTIRALDGAVGPVDLGRGLLSRDGWTLIDDSARPLFDDSDPPWPVSRPVGKRIDWYFLGYGHDYLQALRDFSHVAGRIPMPPRYAFGYWLSRYWAYTDRDLMNLVKEFERRSLPLDVLVIDMDWHETLSEDWGRDRPLDQAGERVGWTGYTWNRDYFPDPVGFLRWTEHKGLRTPLNLHPASGIHPHENQYEPMARAMGINPATGKYVPFKLGNRRFVEAYFEHVIHPMEKEGVDFWWLDWLPGDQSWIPGLDPTWWVNHVFFDDMNQQDQRRPLIMHRYGGLGNHRYPIGFSGDTYSRWEVLAFLPKFTATASNVLFGYWSHDIGGHLGGNIDPELYTRWVQFGAFSPIFRTHVTKLAEARRTFWEYPHEYEAAMHIALKLRLELVPYLYTAARLAHDTGESIVRPMYYSHPNLREAYEFDGQYMLGPDLVVSPVVRPREAGSTVVVQRVWLPPGQWFEWWTGALHLGGRIIDSEVRLDEIPLFVRAGAILPLQTGDRPAASWNGSLILAVFPGADGDARIYEDDGISNGYRQDEFAWTRVETKTIGEDLRIEIGPTIGHYSEIPERGVTEIRLIGALPPLRVLYDGEELFHRRDQSGSGWWFDGQKMQTVIRLPESGRRRHHVLQAFGVKRDKQRLLQGVTGLMSRLADARDILNELTPRRGAPRSLIRAIQTGRRIELEPGSADRELIQLPDLTQRVISEIRTLPVQRDVVNRALVAVSESPVPPRPAPDPPPRTRLLTLAIILLLCAAAAGSYGLYRLWRGASSRVEPS